MQQDVTFLDDLHKMMDVPLPRALDTTLGQLFRQKAREENEVDNRIGLWQEGFDAGYADGEDYGWHTSRDEHRKYYLAKGFTDASNIFLSGPNYLFFDRKDPFSPKGFVSENDADMRTLINDNPKYAKFKPGPYRLKDGSAANVFNNPGSVIDTNDDIIFIDIEKLINSARPDKNTLPRDLKVKLLPTGKNVQQQTMKTPAAIMTSIIPQPPKPVFKGDNGAQTFSRELKQGQITWTK